MTINESDAGVSRLKELIAERFGLAADRQDLWCNAESMSNDKKVTDYCKIRLF